jgi:hypothetical protein
MTATAIEDGQKCLKLLPCKLTETEVAERGEQMAECELAEEKLKAERRQLNGQITVQVRERARLGHIIDNKEEDREIECKWISNYASNQWLLIRQDTGQQVDAVTMTGRDLQGSLSFGNGEIVDSDPLGLGDIETVDTEPPAPANGKAAKSKPKRTPPKKAPPKKKATTKSRRR